MRPFFSDMRRIWVCLSMPIILTYFPSVEFRACQGVETARKYLVSVLDEIYNVTEFEFRYPGLPDGDITHPQPGDTRAERWMRSLVQEDSDRRKARQDEQDRIAEAEKRRHKIEDEKVDFALKGIRSREPPTKQRIRRQPGLSSRLSPSPRQQTVPGIFRASGPASPRTGRETRDELSGGGFRYRGLKFPVYKHCSTQTDPEDPIEPASQQYVTIGVQTDLKESPAQKEPEAPAAVPKLPVPEPSPEPASPEDTPNSPDKGKAHDGPKPTINFNLVIVSETGAADEVQESESSAAPTPVSASIPLQDSPKPEPEVKPEPVRATVTALSIPKPIESFPLNPASAPAPAPTPTPTPAPAPAIQTPARQGPVHLTKPIPETHKRIDRTLQSSTRHLKSKANAGKSNQTQGASVRKSRRTSKDEYKLGKSLEIYMTRTQEPPSPSFVKPRETPKVTDTTTMSTNVTNHSILFSHHDSEHDARNSSVSKYPTGLEPGHDESGEDLYDDSQNGHSDADDQRGNLERVPELPKAKTVPPDNDKEMMDRSELDPVESVDMGTQQNEVAVVSPANDAQMADAPQLSPEQRKRIEEAALDVFRGLVDASDEESPDRSAPKSDLMEFSDEESSGRSEPKSELLEDPMPGILTEDLEYQEDEEAISTKLKAFHFDDSERNTQDTQPPSTQPPITQPPITQPEPTNADDPRLEAFRAKAAAAKDEPSRQDWYDTRRVPKDLDPPDLVKKATAEQLANRKIAKPISRSTKSTPTVEIFTQSVSQGESSRQRQHPTQQETSQQPPVQATAGVTSDIAEMDSTALNIIALATSAGIAVGNQAPTQAASSSAQETNHQDTDNAQEINVQRTDSQETNTQGTNKQESTFSDTEIEEQTVTAKPAESAAPSSQQPHSNSASIFSAGNQPSPIQPTTPRTLPAAQQQNTTENNAAVAAGPSNTQKQPDVPRIRMGGLVLPGGNEKFNPTVTDTPTPAPKQAGPDPEKVAELRRKQEAQLKAKKERSKKPVSIFIPKKRNASVPSKPKPSQRNLNAPTQGENPSLESFFGPAGSSKKKTGPKIIDINDLPEEVKKQVRKHDAEGEGA
ncbi:hypothetical protein IL306_007609 [Fusarium sp. DS 682]|nr:hypothetical protein IL306_007609 [Fusarium sp. DS 682]